VSPEIVFNDLQLGQLFVVRVAGPALSQCDVNNHQDKDAKAAALGLMVLLF